VIPPAHLPPVEIAPPHRGVVIDENIFFILCASHWFGSTLNHATVGRVLREGFCLSKPKTRIHFRDRSRPAPCRHACITYQYIAQCAYYRMLSMTIHQQYMRHRLTIFLKEVLLLVLFQHLFLLLELLVHQLCLGGVAEDVDVFSSRLHLPTQYLRLG
jgi:hypothetical protein